MAGLGQGVTDSTLGLICSEPEPAGGVSVGRDMKYAAYLKSKEWRHIRRNVLRRDKWICQSCQGKATEVHHLSYDWPTLRGQRLEELMSLCRTCHEAVSYDATGVKRPMKTQREWSLEVRRTLRERQQRAPRLPHHQVPAKSRIERIRELSQQYAEGRMK